MGSNLYYKVKQRRRALIRMGDRPRDIGEVQMYAIQSKLMYITKSPPVSELIIIICIDSLNRCFNNRERQVTWSNGKYL